jgi:CheY-like chemotaxis protein
VLEHGGNTVDTPRRGNDLEHRRFPRIRVTLPVTGRAPQYPGLDLRGTVRDVGRGGLMAEFPVVLVPGSLVRLTLQTRQGLLEELARVVWVKTAEGTVRHGFAFPEPKVRDFAASLSLDEHGRKESADAAACGAGPSSRATRVPILIVDDDAALREAAAAILEAAGYAPLPARDGREALELFQRYAPEIGAVLLDLHLPGENAGDLYDEIRRIHSEVRVLLMSGEPEGMALTRFGRAGLAGFLYKPSGIPHWIGKIEALLSD